MKLADSVTYAGSATAATMGASKASSASNELELTIYLIIAGGGFAVGLAQFLMNWYYKHQHLQLERDQKKPR